MSIKDYIFENLELQEAFSNYVKDNKVQEPDCSQDAEELALYIKNDGQLYRSRRQPIEKNLTAKYNKGDYNAELAIKAFFNLVEEGAQKYIKEFEETPSGAKKFDAKSKEQAAAQLTWEFEQEL